MTKTRTLALLQETGKSAVQIQLLSCCEKRLVEDGIRWVAEEESLF